MKLETNANYTVLLNPNDVADLMAGNKLNFWITIENHEDITFALKKE